MKRALFLGSCLCGVFGVAVVWIACSGGDSKIPDAGMEAGPRDTGVDCGPLPMITCFAGKPGKACGNFPQPLKAVDGGPPCPVYGCGPGTVPVSQCGCQAETLKIDAGDDCPGMEAGTD